MKASLSENSLTFEIGDDGRGIDWDAIARKAADVKHGSDKCEGKIKKTCSLSGTFPHGGSEE